MIRIPATTTRILLNHFKWDKEKLYERFYDGDQDQMFAEARVVNPLKPALTTRPRASNAAKKAKMDEAIGVKKSKKFETIDESNLVPVRKQSSSSSTEECEICFIVLPCNGCYRSGKSQGKKTGLEIRENIKSLYTNKLTAAAPSPSLQTTRRMKQAPLFSTH
ncbi:E3 ubiquitin-protein ligase arih1 [Homalodisca vitripennis]|nr:E3 ubiquitin-protein ligase arih1 [Homalodisca vitripennis]